MVGTIRLILETVVKGGAGTESDSDSTFACEIGTAFHEHPSLEL